MPHMNGAENEPDERAGERANPTNVRKKEVCTREQGVSKAKSELNRMIPKG